MTNIANTHDISFTNEHNVIRSVLHIVQPLTFNNVQLSQPMIILNELIRLIT